MSRPPYSWPCPYCGAGPFASAPLQDHYEVCARMPKPPAPPPRPRFHEERPAAPKRLGFWASIMRVFDGVRVIDGE